jgi:hypothetical protein
MLRASNHWLPYLTWSIQRSGRLGLLGMALLLGSLVFLVSAQLPLVQQVNDLRSQVASARAQLAAAPAPKPEIGTTLLHTLPVRDQIPELIGVLLEQAGTAHLSLDTGKYETTAAKGGGVVSYQISFPVTGPYPQIRQFIDATLTALPATAVTELSLTRKTIGDVEVEAQVHKTVFTRDGP